MPICFSTIGARHDENITAHTGTVSNAPADFSPDGTRLLFTSTRIASSRHCAATISRPVATSPIYEVDWDIVAAAYSKRRTISHVYVNEDSRFAARVLEPPRSQPVALDGIPQGLVRGISISRDDAALAFYASDGSVPERAVCRNRSPARRSG